MKNIRIERINNGVITYFTVVADSERFGKDEIMYEGTLEGCKKYIKDAGYRLADCVNYNSFCHNIVRKSTVVFSRQKSIERTFYRDKWNPNKTWEVAKLAGGYYLRQYINGIQFGRGVKTSKKFIESIGVFGFEKVPGKELEAQ